MLYLFDDDSDDDGDDDSDDDAQALHCTVIFLKSIISSS
jgi:hypothetical protein